MRSTNASDPVGLGAGAEEDRLERLRGVREAQERPVARARVGLGADEVDRVGGAEHQRPLAVVEPDDALAVHHAQYRPARGEIAPSPAIGDSWPIARGIMTERVVRFGAGAERGDGDREGDFRPRADRVDGDELVRVMGVAAARAEPVDGELDVRGHVAGVAGAAAGADRQRPAEQLAAPGSTSRSPTSLAASPSRASAGRARHRARPRRRSAAPGRAPASSACSRSPRRSQTSSPAAGTTLNASPARITVGRRGQPVGPGRVASPRRPGGPPRRARAGRCDPSPAPSPSARRPRCASTRSVAAALRFATTASSPPGPSWPASKQRQAS